MPPIVSDEYKEKKRREILESALRAFAEKGYQTATIDDIVAHSGISKGAIYNYFQGKEDIYIQLMNMRTDLTFQKLEEAFGEFHTATEKIGAIFDMYKNSGNNENWLDLVRVHIEFLINSSRHKELKTIMIERFQSVFQQFVMEIIVEGKRKGEFSEKAAPELAASLIWAVIDGIVMHYSVMEELYPYEQSIETAKEMILSHLKGPEKDN